MEMPNLLSIWLVDILKFRPPLCWVQPDTYRVTIAVFTAKAFQHGNVIDVYIYAKSDSSFDLFEVNAVWCEENLFRFKSCMQTKLYLVNAYAVEIGTVLFHQL